MNKQKQISGYEFSQDRDSWITSIYCTRLMRFRYARLRYIDGSYSLPVRLYTSLQAQDWVKHCQQHTEEEIITFFERDASWPATQNAPEKIEWNRYTSVQGYLVALGYFYSETLDGYVHKDIVMKWLRADEIATYSTPQEMARYLGLA